MNRINLTFSLVIIITLFLFSTALACTNFIVTKGASIDGSVTITYTCDGEFHPLLRLKPAADYEPGDSLEITSWGDKVLGKIHQVEHTYAVTRLINEHQVVIGETTFDGRVELQSKVGILHYWDLMQIALQRAKTAREAIEVITSLCDTYGYSSTGESFSIGDPDEAWILEMIGPGKDKIGATWVAMKIPDGMVSGHANKARIGEFPLNKPKVCLYSDNVIDLAIEMGYYDPKGDKKFNFSEAYCPTTPKNRRYGDMRVWSMFRSLDEPFS
jgi:dipeptidase